MVYGNQDRAKTQLGAYLHAHCQGRYVMHHVGQTGHQQEFYEFHEVQPDVEFYEVRDRRTVSTIHIYIYTYVCIYIHIYFIYECSDDVC